MNKIALTSTVQTRVPTSEKCLILPDGVSFENLEKIYQVPDLKSSVPKTPINNSIPNSPSSDKKGNNALKIDDKDLKRKAGDLLHASPQMLNKKAKLTINRPKVIKDCEKLEKEIALLETELRESPNKDEKIEKDKKLEVQIKEINEVTKKWKEACQSALFDLQKCFVDRGFNSDEIKLSKLIGQLGIDPQLLNFNIEDEDFE